MPCLITALTRSHTIKKTTGEKNEQNKKKFTAKIQHLNLIATSSNVKIQSEETLTTAIHFSVTR